MRLAGIFIAVAGLIFSTACLTDYNPEPGSRTQTQDGAGAKVYGLEGGVAGYGTTPDPYTATQLLSYDNRSGLSPSPAFPVIIENAANDGFGAFSRDGVVNRDGHGTLNHKGVTFPAGTMHTFRRSVLCVDTAPGCQFQANIVRDNSGNAGAGYLVCIDGPWEINDTMDLPLQDSQGNRLESLDDLVGLLVKSRANVGDTSLDLKLRKLKLENGEVAFHEPLQVHMGNARLFNFTLAADGNREQVVQLIRHLKRTRFKTNDEIKDLSLDFGEFRVKMPENMSISFNMKKMDEILVKFTDELNAARSDPRPGMRR